MRRPAPTRRATSAVPEAVPPPRATSDRLQYETRWPRILVTKGSRPSSQFSASPRLSHARLFQVEVANQGANTPGVDGLTAAHVEEVVGVSGFLDDLRTCLKNGSFRPLPVREHKIPKPGGS